MSTTIQITEEIKEVLQSGIFMMVVPQAHNQFFLTQYSYRFIPALSIEKATLNGSYFIYDLSLNNPTEGLIIDLNKFQEELLAMN